MALRYRIRTVAILFLCLFVLPIIGLARIQVLESTAMQNHGGNQRNMEDLDTRGSVLDRKSQPLAESVKGERYYPLGEITGPLLGYLTPTLGDAGLEAAFVARTRGMTVPRNPWDALVQIRKGNRHGDDIVLTIDSELQTFAYDSLAGYRGAVVVIDTRSGELLALASRPSFDPNPEALKRDWKRICQDSSAPLIERCTQGMYPPGSTFKIVVMSGALEDGLVTPSSSYNCTGKMDVGNFVLNCNWVHNTVSLKEALAYSCNMAFARIGLQMGIEGLCKWMDLFGMEQKLELVPGAATALEPTNSSPSSPAEAAIGQGDTLLTPLHMARATTVIARRGEDIEPRLIKAQTRMGRVEWQPGTAHTHRVISENTAHVVAEAMAMVTTDGTGRAAAIPGIGVASKTGSAENPHGQTHAWYVGYAPLNNPRIAVAVILENAGGGGRFAAPVGGRVLQRALQLFP